MEDASKLDRNIAATDDDCPFWQIVQEEGLVRGRRLRDAHAGLDLGQEGLRRAQLLLEVDVGRRRARVGRGHPHGLGRGELVVSPRGGDDEPGRHALVRGRGAHAHGAGAVQQHDHVLPSSRRAIPVRRNGRAK